MFKDNYNLLMFSPNVELQINYCCQFYRREKFQHLADLNNLEKLIKTTTKNNTGEIL